MAGVVVVTLVALVAFDVGAVTTMRRYLLGQTDKNLQVALNLTTPRLAVILASGATRVIRGVPHTVPAPAGPSRKVQYPALPGAFDLAFLPLRGTQVTQARRGPERHAGPDQADVHEREAGQQQMRRFFADASHELRTPLASLRANAELYQQGALRGPEEVDEVMDRIVVETRRMGRLVDDMDRGPRADLAGAGRRRPDHGRRRGTAAPRRRQPAHERASAHPR
jgi:signal transduction histidine kinase